jgi:hypothetical protein
MKRTTNNASETVAEFMAGAEADTEVSSDGAGLSHAREALGAGFPTAAPMWPTKVEP